MTPETPQTPEMISGNSPESYSGNSGISIDTGIPEFPEKPEQKVIRILLSQAASDALTATGEGAFVIVHKAMRGTEEPESIGRWAITLAPASWQNACDACRVLTGELKAIRPKRAFGGVRQV